MDEPLPVTVAGLKPAVAPVGKPVTAKLTVPVNPFTAETLAVYVAPEPTNADWVLGVAETEKSVTLRVALAVCDTAPLVDVMVNG